MLLDEIVHDARLGERGNISQVVGLIGSYFPQDAAHYLARARFRQSSAKLSKQNLINRLDGKGFRQIPG